MENKFNFGDIVLLNFPFTDNGIFKKRPALVINDLDDDDIIVCRITSQIYKTPNDIYIDNWESIGLKLPSVIRVHKLATLEKTLIERIIGNIDNPTKLKVQELFTKLTD